MKNATTAYRIGRSNGALAVGLFLVSGLLVAAWVRSTTSTPSSNAKTSEFQFRDSVADSLPPRNDTGLNASDDPRVRTWREAEGFAGKLAQFETVFWEPRDTESLRMHLQQLDAWPQKKVLEIGTGTGLLSLFMAQLGAERIIATDINPNAVANAEFNAKRLGLSERVEVRQVAESEPGPFAVIEPSETFDLIVSNPPWEDGKVTEVSQYALYDERFRLLDAVLAESASHLRPNGKVLLAFGCRKAIERIQETGPINGWTVKLLDDRELESLDEVFLPGMLLELTLAEQTDALEAPSEDVSADLFPRRAQSENLPNLIQVAEKVFSGGLPQNEAAFAELREMGVRTVISVDGARPDVATAARFGLRYVHLPHGYDGISAARVSELAKAVRDLDGPIYVHCHHGKHRSPAAAATACVSTGLIGSRQAALVLALANTSSNYVGLFQAVQRAKPIGNQRLDELQVEFSSTAKVPPLAEVMVQMEHRFDVLRRFSENEWQVDEQHPDLDPAHEALLLRELWAELPREGWSSSQELLSNPEFLKEIAEAERLALELEHQLLQYHQLDQSASDLREELQRTFSAIQANCVQCHQIFRDQPR